MLNFKAIFLSSVELRSIKVRGISSEISRVLSWGAVIPFLRHVLQQKQQSINAEIIRISSSDNQQKTKIPVNYPQFGRLVVLERTRPSSIFAEMFTISQHEQSEHFSQQTTCHSAVFRWFVSLLVPCYKIENRTRLMATEHNI